ncbi:MAG TPA: hypothetical protein VE010_22205 [Thermoanaerobaculia bacterium]|nr:hypothetical protein [Thermoanaerobaculia bacterium]
MSVTTLDPRPAVRGRSMRPAPRRSAGTSLFLLWLLFAAGSALTLTMLFVSVEMRYVLAPLLALAASTAVYAGVLFRRDRQLPVFEPASLAVAATFVYGAFPLIGFIAGGLRWHTLTDYRLTLYNPGPREVGTFGWRYALYLAFLVATYLIVRGRRAVLTTKLNPPGSARVITIVGLFAFTTIFLLVISFRYGISLSPSYADIYSGNAKTAIALPRAVLQFAGNAMAIRLLLEQLFILVLMLHWRFLASRFVLVAFLAWVALDNAGGARTELVLLMMSAVLLYHRLVTPLKLRVLIPAGALILGGFIALGVLRDLGGRGLVEESDTPLLASSNEFQVIFSNAVDLYYRHHAGILPPVPWQLYWADLLALVPSQLLPFPKIDPSIWYIISLDAQDSNVGLMFGLLAQAVLGRDWLELALRGIGLGLFLGLLQRWYVRNHVRFWPTVLIMFLSVWMFYTVRQSTFFFFYYIVYRFLPTMIATELLRQVLITPRRIRRAAQRLQQA